MTRLDAKHREAITLGARCRHCGTTSHLTYHPITYDTIQGEVVDTEILCRRCCWMATDNKHRTMDHVTLKRATLEP